MIIGRALTISKSIGYGKAEKRRKMRVKKSGFDFWDVLKVTTTF